MKHRVLKRHKVTDKIWVLADEDDNLVYTLKFENLGFYGTPTFRWVAYKGDTGQRVEGVGGERIVTDLIERLKWGV